MRGAPESDAAPEAIGMIAGSGLLPVCFARGARKRGIRVVAAAIKGEASPELAKEVDQIHWTGLARLGSWINVFKRAGIDRAVLCGGVTKRRMFDNLASASLLPDVRSARLWYKKLKSHEDHTVLEAVADELEAEGIRVESSVLYCPELLVEEGSLTKKVPTPKQWEDIRFGWPIVKQIAALQIGQCIVVKNKTVIAVEGIDGTDATLRRGGTLGRGAVTALKVAKEGQDERFDIPCIGPQTIGIMAEAGVAVLAIEAGKTILLEQEETRKRAERAKVVVVGVGCATPPCFA